MTRNAIKGAKTLLSQRTASEVVRKDLQARMDALTGNASRDGDGGAQAPKEEKKDWLAVLAQRLEARSLQ